MFGGQKRKSSKLGSQKIIRRGYGGGSLRQEHQRHLLPPHKLKTPIACPKVNIFKNLFLFSESPAYYLSENREKTNKICC